MNHFYIHIPFCDSKCHYCSFNSFTGHKISTFQKYFFALEKQLLFELNRFNVQAESIETLYFGGGTPSCIKAGLYHPIFEILNPYLTKNCEITMEANPNSATTKWLCEIRKLGVNRISIGVQSFNDAKLKLLGRIHSAKSAKMAVARAKNAGFDNISIDLIYDTAFDNVEFVKKEVQTAISLPIMHISAYSLTIESESAFEGKQNLKNEDLESSEALFEALQDAGFEHYEISNFGKIKSRHNTAYWCSANYAGIGAGAVGFFENKRLYPQKSIDGYIVNPLNIDEELLSTEEMRFERVFLGLRSYIGVDLKDIKEGARQRVLDLESAKKISIKKGRLINQNFLLADEIALYLVA